MGLFGRNYNKPGRGVEKDEPEKRALFRFFELYFRKFWQIMNTALLYFFAALPALIVVVALTFLVMSSFTALSGGALKSVWGDAYIYLMMYLSFFVGFVYVSFIGSGPASAGISYVMGCFAGDYHTFIWQDFKDKIKENFKQGLAVFFIDLAAFAALAYAFVIYYSFGGVVGYIRYLIVVIAIIFAAMHLFIYPLMVSYELKIKDIYKNAFILTMAHLPVNLLITAIVIGIHWFLDFTILSKFSINMLPVIFLLEMFLIFGITAFITSFRSECLFSKYFKVEGEDINGND